MSIYVNIARENYASLRGKLKPTTCESCKADGLTEYGECEKCLANQAYNREYLETHTFQTDSNFGSYHDYAHKAIKALPLRLPNEKPFLYYGIELEIEFDNNWTEVFYENDYGDKEPTDDIQSILDEFAKITDGMFVFEEDGSLNNGVECISRPMSYPFWTSKETKEKLDKGFAYLKEHGALVNQPSSNGMHIHISKKFFERGGYTFEDRDKASKSYKEFDWLFQKFQPEIEKIGERKYTIYCRSKVMELQEEFNSLKHRVNGNVGDIKVSGKMCKGGDIGYNNHGVAVNSTDKTVEVRVFKSTIETETVLSRIEFVRNLAHAVRDNTSNATFTELLHTKDNLYLDNYIRKIELNCKRNKEEFDLEKVNTDEIEVEA